MKAIKIGLLSVGITILMIQPGRAANYAITAQIVTAFSSSFQVLPSVPDVSKNSGVPRYYTISFTLMADGFNSALNQRSFGNMVFDINLSGNSLATLSASPWFPNNPIVDTNGPEESGKNFSLWESNEDIGNPTDMKAILLDAIPRPENATSYPADPRKHVGEGTGTAIGSVTVYWDGFGPESLNVAVQVSAGSKEISFARISDGLAERDTAAIFSGATINFGVTPVVGDFDGDGDVDGADFVVWQDHFPTSSGATLNDGDGDGDGDVDGADFVIWQSHFPTAPAPGASPVPEPAAWILLAIGGLFALRRRR
jgi:hypothetical protein